LKWSFRTGGGVRLSPAVAADGKIIWLAVESSPAIAADGTIYVGSTDGKLYAFWEDNGGPADSPWPIFGQNPQRTGRHKEKEEAVRPDKEEKVDRLIQELRDEDRGVRLRAAWALGKIGKPAVEPLIAALKDEDSDVRESAATALWKIGDPRAVTPLITALGDEDERVRRNAAEALGRIGDPRAVEPLIAALRDEDSDVRESAALALGKTRDPRAVKPLIAALRDEDRDVRESAAWALEEITGKYFGEDVARWQKWWEENKEAFLKER
ncbi:HEAT repeat domain-containing protein, partial [candidate division NPL-UPA2 bacterium]|nr:HEAT repeat domain-containing protein [candidate division NPL-UPA2 bacterium]